MQKKKSLMTQFHATPDELVEYLNSMSTGFGLFVTMIVFRPFSIREIEGDISVKDLKQEGSTDIRLTVNRPNLKASSLGEFEDLNPGTIILEIGEISDKGLHESSLGFLSDDLDKYAVAKKLASKLKKITKAGAIAVSPVSGAEAKIRSHRYTEGAKKLYDEGVLILPIAGHSFYKLPE